MEMEKTQTLRGLYGSQVQRNKAVGYCRHHNAHLTENMLKQHECLRKECNALKKHEENSYWAERESLKLLKKERKMRYN